MFLKKRILALDLGQKRIGLALSDDIHLTAQPLTTLFITNQSDTKWLQSLHEIIESKNVGMLLIGIALDQRGEKKTSYQLQKPFIKKITQHISLPIVEWDERFSTVQAEKHLISADVKRKKRKEVIDKIAATILLQSYLDSGPIMQ